jgi:hypothetical protein
MAMPDRSVEDDHRTCVTAGMSLVGVALNAVHRQGRNISRRRHEAGRAIFGPESVDHQDEADQWPSVLAWGDIAMQRLGDRAGPDISDMKGAQLERPADQGRCCFQKRLVAENISENGRPFQHAVYPHRRRGVLDLAVFSASNSASRDDGGELCGEKRSGGDSEAFIRQHRSHPFPILPGMTE